MNYSWMPQVPAMNESRMAEFKSFDFFGWVGFFAPAKTSPEVVAHLNREIAEANSSEQFRAFIRAHCALARSSKAS